MRHATGRLALTLVIVAAPLLAGCATHSPNIADLAHNPGRYYNKTVCVEGVVSRAWAVPFVPVRVYKVQDATGEIAVLSHGGHVPPPGARVEVTGRVEDAAVIGGRPVGLHITEDHLHVKR